MDLRFTPEEIAFRDEVRAFFRTQSRPRSAQAGEGRKHLARTDHRHLASARSTHSGWAVPHWPKEWGGTGWTPVQHLHLPGRVAADAGAAAARRSASHGRAGDHRLRHRGAEAALPAAHRQSRRLVVPGLLRARRGLRSRLAEDPAERDGDHYIVNGQKTWTTLGQYADWIFCLVRTDPAGQEAGGHLLPADRHEDARHHVRPIITIDGGHEVNEVFFDDVQGAGREPGRRGEQGLGLRQVPARPRAHRHRARRRLQGADPRASRSSPRRSATATAADRGRALPRASSPRSRSS